MNNYPDEIYFLPKLIDNFRGLAGGTLAERAYDLGRKHAKQETTTEPEWHNLTEQIAAGANIDWEKLDGMKARCVHEEMGALTYKLERVTSYPEYSGAGWFKFGATAGWGSVLESAWYGEYGWTLYIDGEIPLKRKTADELPLAMCFIGKHQPHGDPALWIVVDNEIDKVCIAPSVNSSVLASEIEVIKEFGIGMLAAEGESS